MFCPPGPLCWPYYLFGSIRQFVHCLDNMGQSLVPEALGSGIMGLQIPEAPLLEIKGETGLPSGPVDQVSEPPFGVILPFS